jgi:hypothetical protein
MDATEPKCIKSSADKADPNLAMPYTDALDPIRKSFLIDTVEAQLTKSKIETDDDMRDSP